MNIVCRIESRCFEFIFSDLDDYCFPGEELWFYLDDGTMIFDYRYSDGTLFSCIAATLLQARGLRDQWLMNTKQAYAMRNCGSDWFIV